MPIFSEYAIQVLRMLTPHVERLMQSHHDTPDSRLGECLAGVVGAAGETIAKSNPAIIDGLSDTIAEWVKTREE